MCIQYRLPNLQHTSKPVYIHVQPVTVRINVVVYHENNSFKMYLQTINNTIYLNGIIIVVPYNTQSIIMIIIICAILYTIILQRILTSRYYNKYHSCIIIYMYSI